MDRMFYEPDEYGVRRVVYRPVRDDEPVRFPAGTRFVCEAGHHCATLARPVYVNGRLDTDRFEPSPPYQTTARHGVRMGYCLCGRPWAGKTLDGSVFTMRVEGRGWA